MQSLKITKNSKSFPDKTALRKLGVVFPVITAVISFNLKNEEVRLVKGAKS